MRNQPISYEKNIGIEWEYDWQVWSTVPYKREYEWFYWEYWEMIPVISYDDGFLLGFSNFGWWVDGFLQTKIGFHGQLWDHSGQMWGFDLGRQRYWPAPVEETLESWRLGRVTIEVYLKLPQGCPYCNYHIYQVLDQVYHIFHYLFCRFIGSFHFAVFWKVGKWLP